MKKNSFISILLFLLSATLAFSNEPLIEKTKAPLSVALPLLQSIQQHAIVVGEGPTHMYAFIDPVCPRSRDFVSMIFESEKMRKRYTYYFYYYELKRFNSKGLIARIYSEDEPLGMMKKVMVEKKEVAPLRSILPEIQNKMDQISDVAKQLDINKRPYVFVVKPQKGGK